MNKQTVGFYVDIAMLVTGLIILVAFLAFPFIGLAGIGVTPLQLVSLSNLANEQIGATVTLLPVFMIVIAICALLTSVSAAVALGKQELSRIVSYVVMAFGAVILLILLVFLFQIAADPLLTSVGGGLSIALSVMGFGYWLIFLGSIFLIAQVFFGRTMVNATPPMPIGSPPPPVFVQQVAAPQAPAPQAAPEQQRPSRPYVNAWLIDLETDHSFQLYQGETRVGRSRQRNDVILDSANVSREHLIIRQEGQHYVAYLTGSRVPPYINGQALQSKQVLNTNDEIVLGDKQLRFVRS